ncbi:hypothetical protein KCU77_g10959, partial [Aureobasidium melanogenum]
MEGSNAVSDSPLASSRVQKYNNFAEDKDDSNTDMNKSAWILVGEDFDAEPQKLETTSTQDMAEVNTEDEQSTVQTPELLPEMSEPNHTTNSQYEMRDLESYRDSGVVTNRSTLLPTNWRGIKFWPGEILRFVLYSPLRNLLSQAIDFF